MSEDIRASLDLPLPGYLADHHWEGRVVLPAVEALAQLASAVKAALPGTNVAVSRGARFLRFLPVPQDSSRMGAVASLAARSDNEVQATLLTETQAGTSGIRRSREHVTVVFGGPAALPEVPLDLACAAEGSGTRISFEDLYARLVPFGPAYRNAREPIFLSRDGAVGRIVCPGLGAGSPLGSPFALDTAFHIACAWGQRFRGDVPFPLGYEERIVVRPAGAGEELLCRVLPAAAPDETGGMRCDIWILDTHGAVTEVIRSARLGDTTGGRVQSPAWIRAEAADPLIGLQPSCRAMSLIEHAGVLPLAEHTFTTRERERYDRLGSRRRCRYTAARLALKRVARRLAGDRAGLKASEIETVDEDGVRPCCRTRGMSMRCSVAHDDRFAVAVADPDRIGVDVETISDKPARGRRLFLLPEEISLTERSGEDSRTLLTRIWTIKEAAAKALGLNLPQAWRRVRVTETGNRTSRMVIGDRTVMASHARIDEHLFTVLRLAGWPEESTG